MVSLRWYILLPVSSIWLLLVSRTRLCGVIWPPSWAARTTIRTGLWKIWHTCTIATVATATPWATCHAHRAARVWRRSSTLLRVRATAIATTLPSTVRIPSTTLVPARWVPVWPSWPSGLSIVMT